MANLSDIEKILGELVKEKSSEMLTDDEQVISLCAKKLQNFYSKIREIDKNVIFNNSILNQMKDTQISNEQIQSDFYEKIMRVRDMDENNALILAREGYGLLTEVGEKIRTMVTGKDQSIQYGIYYIGSKGSTNEGKLFEKYLELDDFLKSFKSISTDGKIQLGGFGRNNYEVVKDNRATKWETVYSTIQEERRTMLEQLKGLEKDEIEKLFLKQEYSTPKGTIQTIIYLLTVEDGTPEDTILKKLQDIRGKFSERQKVYWSKIIQNRDIYYKQVINSGKTLGRGIEITHKMTTENIDYSLANAAVQGENTKFYEGPDYVYGEKRIQAKMTNATVNLQTITNGIVELTQYLIDLSLKLKEIPEEAKKKVTQTAKGSSQKTYEMIEKEAADEIKKMMKAFS